MYRIIFFVLLLYQAGFCQGKDTSMESSHNHTGMEMGTENNDSMKTMMNPGHNKMGSHKMEMMTDIIMINVPMSMEGSGTSWLPEETPMYMTMYHSNDWMFMLHGSINFRYTKYGSQKKADKIDAPNWIMIGAANMPDKNNQVGFRAMLSMDRLTEGGGGYPLLYQTGETWKDRPLIDRQHPHDLFGELSFSYSHLFSNSTSGFIYLGYPGEPALGPTVYLHRVSAMFNPDAPLGHHWQDATHITFGVATIGFVFNMLKIDASIFTGREPDENRYNFDKPLFDSYSGRISFNPSKNISLQVSSGYLKNPEGDNIDVMRTTASVIHSIVFSKENYWTSSFIWGLNNEDPKHAAEPQHSILLETLYNFVDNGIYGRFEFVQKPQKELGIMIDPEITENIFAYTLGYKRKILSFSGINIHSGVQGTLYSQSELLKKYYGSDPYSFQFYLGVTPALMIH
jgi:hypothetical protein